jgi:hypothetical protein
MIKWWQKGMAGSRPPDGHRAAIDLTAKTGFEPRVGGDACDCRLSGTYPTATSSLGDALVTAGLLCPFGKPA